MGRSKGRRRRDGKEKGKENKGERRVSQHLNLWLVRSGSEDRVSIRFLGGSAEEEEEEVIRPRLLTSEGSLTILVSQGGLGFVLQAWLTLFAIQQERVYDLLFVGPGRDKGVIRGRRGGREEGGGRRRGREEGREEEGGGGGRRGEEGEGEGEEGRGREEGGGRRGGRGREGGGGKEEGREEEGREGGGEGGGEGEEERRGGGEKEGRRRRGGERSRGGLPHTLG